MTDTSTPAPAVPPAAAPPVKQRMPLVALILTAVGLLLAVSPAGAGFAWLFVIPAIVLAIISLIKRKQPKWMALTAVIVAPIAWIIAISVFSVTAFSAGFSSAVNDKPEASSEAPVAAPGAPGRPALPSTRRNGDPL